MGSSLSTRKTKLAMPYNRWTARSKFWKFLARERLGQRMTTRVAESMVTWLKWTWLESFLSDTVARQQKE